MNTKSFFAMNIYKTAAMLLTVTLSVAFTACSDDDRKKLSQRWKR